MKPLPESHQVFYQDDFTFALIDDLNRARGLVLLQSPYLGVGRINFLRPALKNCSLRGVRVCVFARKPKHDKHESQEQFLEKLETIQAATHLLAGCGAHVNFRPQVHEKVAVIDESIFWDGSLNILSFNRSSERMTRWQSRQKVEEGIAKHQLSTCEICCAPIVSGDELCAITCRQIGLMIARRRKMLGLTQRDLANKAIMRQPRIAEVESGSDDLKVSTIMRLFGALDLSLTSVPKFLLPSLALLVEQTFSENA